MALVYVIGIRQRTVIAGSNWILGFFINLPLGALAVIFLALIQIPDTTAKEPFTIASLKKVIPLLDLWGFVIFAPTAVMLLLALQLGADGTHAWNSPTIIGLFCGSGVLAIVFISWEILKGDNAMIPPSIVRQRVVWTSTGQTMCMATNIFGASIFLPIYFQAVKGYGPTMSGVAMLPSIISQLFTIVATGAAGKLLLPVCM
jgi:hypothetical protein